MISNGPDLVRIFDAYRVCEFATLGSDGTVLPWPTAALLRPDGSFVVTTSISFPQKAFNIRRDGRVALLFSDPTGSGLDDAPQVLVRGEATCPDEIVSSPEGLEEYWSRLFVRQPSSQAYLIPPMRWLMDWYYLRLIITVKPTEIVQLPAGDLDLSSPLPAEGLLGADRIARYPSAVLGATDESGAPVLVRTRPVAGPEGFTVEVAPEVPVTAGPASLMVHEHDEHLANMSNVLVRGELTRTTNDGWCLKPQRVVEPMPGGTARDQLSTLRASRAAAKTYLARRNVARPKVRWDLLQELAPK